MFAFDLYDRDSSGEIDMAELNGMLKELYGKRYAANATAEENKHVLKEKYALAKAMGERVNAARGRIEYHKKSIEAIRRERAMEREGLVGDDGAAARGDDGGDDAAEREESDEEREHKAAIEAEKATYKESFAALRELKKEIERTRAVQDAQRQKELRTIEMQREVVDDAGETRSTLRPFSPEVWRLST